MTVAAETATVYRASNGRRYFTKKTAFLHDAMFRLSLKHEKAGHRDYLEGGEHRQDEFFTEAQWEYFNHIAERYWRVYGRGKPI